MRERGPTPRRVVQTGGPSEMHKGRDQSHPALPVLSVLEASLPEGPTQKRTGGCMCFQTWPAEGTRTTAQPRPESGHPGLWIQSLGPSRHRAQTSHTHTPTQGAAVLEHQIGELHKQLTGTCLGGQEKSHGPPRTRHIHKGSICS